MRPKPRIPSVFSYSSTPENFERSHLPLVSDACACGTLRASASSSAIVCSAAVITFDCGALATTIPRLVAAGDVDVVDADAGPADGPQPLRPWRSARRRAWSPSGSGSRRSRRSARRAPRASSRRRASTSKCSRSSSTPGSPIFSATSTLARVRSSVRSRTQSMQAVSARTSAGSVAGNIAIRSWLRPSLRYGSTSTIPLARSVAASAAASTSLVEVDRADDQRALGRVGHERRRVRRARRPTP